jgi:site-specific recombinase XerC
MARTTSLSCGNSLGTNRVKQPKRKAGESYSTSSYRQAIQRACKKAVVEKWSPNRLRHSFATSIRSEFGLEAAQNMLSHSKADVTQIYAERDLQNACEIAKAVG